MPNPFRMALFSGAEDRGSRAAPTAYCGPDAARPLTLKRAYQNSVVMYVVGLFFMVFSVTGIDTGSPGRGWLSLRIVIFVLIGLSYLGSSWAADGPLWLRITYIAWYFALSATTIPYNGWEFVTFGVYLAVMLATLIPWWISRWAILAWSVFVAACAIPAWNITPMIIGVLSLFVGEATGGGIQAGRIRERLTRAEQRVSVLAVAAERERIARDLHDILGHSLTAISIKSALAARLADQDPAAAKEQIIEVEQIAREVLADVRATTTGMREVRLASEIASARSVLMAAGVEAVTPSALPNLAPARSELLGYVVREGVTNVVRHAEATRCVIAVDDRSVTITDDGVGIRQIRGGSGLAGLRNRVQDAGGTITLSTPPGTGTVVRATFPAGARPATSVPEPVPTSVPESLHISGPEPVEGRPVHPARPTQAGTPTTAGSQQ